MTGHPANGLDDTVHQRVRLGILTIAHEAQRVEFSYLRNNLDLTAANLSQHLGVLENAGLITIEKGYAGKCAHVGHPHESRPCSPRRRNRPAQAPYQPGRTRLDASTHGLAVGVYQNDSTRINAAVARIRTVCGSLGLWQVYH
jgi:hypothetical protein